MQRIFFLLILITLITGCNKPSKPPDFQGRIIDIDKTHILVVSNVSVEEVETMTTNEILSVKAPNAVWLNVNGSSKYKVGQLVNVWYQGGVNHSYPAQAGAKKVEIIEKP